MKNFKVLVLTALLVVATSFIALAGWENDGYGWQYLVKDEPVANTFKQADDGQWYWLGADTYMVTEDFASYNNAKYYLDENGNIAKGWRLLEDGLENEYYAYFNETTGKQVIGNSVTLANGNSYLFDANGAMLTGWVTADLKATTSIAGAKFYCGEAGDLQDGVLRTGWVEYSTDEEAVYGAVSESYWFYFAEKKNTLKQIALGQKATGFNALIKWDDKSGTFSFYDDGVMITGFATIANAVSGDEEEYYYDENGYLVKGWFQEDSQSKVDDFGEPVPGAWFFANKKSGLIQKSQVLRDGDKFYLLDDEGEMLTGRYFLYYEDDTAKMNDALAYAAARTDVVASIYPLATTADVAAEYDEATKSGYYFFQTALNENGNVDGSMTAGAVKGGYYNTTGLTKFQGTTKVVGTSLYVDGKLITAGEDMGYAIVANAGLESVGTRTYDALGLVYNHPVVVNDKTGLVGSQIKIDEDLVPTNYLIIDEEGNIVKGETVVFPYSDVYVRTNKTGNPIGAWYYAY